MCGISACYNSSNAIRKAFNILLKQEERGTDATGIAFIKDNKIEVIKKAIKPSEFKKIIDSIDDSSVYVAIGHNRQATSNLKEKHNDKEAHPFLSESGEFAIVHNGTVSNYSVIKQLLELLGHKFTSGVDSEVYVHILEEILSKTRNREKALNKFYSMTDGNLLILFKDGTLYGLPAKSFYVLIKDNMVLISSIGEVLLKSGTDKFKLLKPEVGRNNQALKLQLRNKKVKLWIYGDWKKEEIEIPEGFVINRHITCDFCRQPGYCEKVTINQREYDRCIKCFMEKKTEPAYYDYRTDYRTIYREGGIVTTYFQKKQTESSKKIKCAGYNHLVHEYKTDFCSLCYQHYCRGCFKDSRRHKCIVKYPNIFSRKHSGILGAWYDWL